MNCLECRRLTLIDPLDDNPARKKHLESCERCARFSEQMLWQDNLIKEAAQVEVPDGFAARILLNQSLQPTSRRPTRGHWLALAASFLLAIAIGPGMISDMFYQPLEDGLVAHMNKHDLMEHADHVHVSDPDEIREVLAAVDTAVPGELGSIVEATTCVINGEVMAHLLMEKDDEHFVVFVIPQQSVVERNFSQGQWIGQFVNVDHGSLAVLNYDGVNLAQASSHFAELFNQSLDGNHSI